MKTKASLFLAAIFFFAGVLNASASAGTTLGDNFSSFGTSGSGSGQFNNPFGVSVDTTNNKIYVIEINNNRVDVMDSGEGGTTLGGHFASFGSWGLGSEHFNGPLGVFVDATNNKIYVADDQNDRVDVMDSGEGGTTLGGHFTSFGAEGTGSGQFQGLAGIFVDTTKNKIYVPGVSNSRINVMDSGGGGTTLGAHFTTFGSNGSGSGQFYDPRGVFVDTTNNKIYMADSGNNRIVVMDSGEGGTTLGAHFTSFGTEGTGAGQFKYPEALSVDTANNKIYVADNGNNRIVIIDSGEDGTTLGDNFTTFGTLGSGNGQLNRPYGISVDTTSSRVYLADAGNNRIAVMDSYSPATSDDSDDSDDSDNSNDLNSAKITSWKAFQYTDNNKSCSNRLKLIIKGRHFDDDAKVKIGDKEAASVDVKNKQKLTAKFCLDKLLAKADHKRKITVKNPDTDTEEADKQIDLDNLTSENGDTNNTNTQNSNDYYDQKTKEGVKHIQEALNKLGYLDQENITGTYGSITTEAVKKFQADNGIEPTGFVGELTKAKLAEKVK
jgi:DNA-binding beta-propeller fold protein YncE